VNSYYSETTITNLLNLSDDYDMKKSQIFKGKTAWITGASSGIGESLVYELVRRGSNVIASSIDAEGLERVKAGCTGKSEMVHCYPFDLAETSAIHLVVKQVIEKAGKIDYLFNIGGISQRARIDETPLWLDRKIFEINYFGTIALTKAVLPYMVTQQSGHILATSSISGRFGFPLRSAYSASKQALHGFFETLYLENKINNIRVSVIIPGRVRTAISLHALDSEGKEHGKLDDGQANGISPEKAAEIIIKGMLKNKREILVGKNELIMLHIRRYFPWLFFRIADKIKA
jgi:dehydrogenase/reductase SDR family protein 7B